MPSALVLTNWADRERYLTNNNRDKQPCLRGVWVSGRSLSGRSLSGRSLGKSSQPLDDPHLHAAASRQSWDVENSAFGCCSFRGSAHRHRQDCYTTRFRMEDWRSKGGILKAVGRERASKTRQRYPLWAVLSAAWDRPALYIDSQLASFCVKVNLNQIRILEKIRLLHCLPLLGRESEQGLLRMG